MKRVYNYVWMLLWPLLFCNGLEAATHAYTAEPTVWTTEANPEDNSIVRETVKKYSVSAGTKLKVENKNGNVVLVNWDKPEIEITLTLTGTGPDNKSIENSLDATKIRFSSDNQLVLAQSEPKWETKSNFFLFGVSKISRSNVKSDYLIKLPKSVPVEIVNSLGNTQIADRTAPVKVVQDYGSLQLGKIQSTATIEVDFAKSVDADFIEKGSMSLNYVTKATIELAQTLQLRSNNSTVNLTRVENLTATTDYGFLNLEEVNAVSVTGNFTKIKVQKLNGKSNFNLNYGTLEVNQLTKAVPSLNLACNFTKVTLWINSAYSASINLTSNFSKLSLSEELGLGNPESGIHKTYVGRVGSDKNSSNSITINSNYGSLSLLAIAQMP